MAETNIHERRRLERECVVFCRYLVRQDPTDYVRTKYRAGLSAILTDAEPARLDATLLRIASTHPLLARLADAYARFILPRSLLRVKLVLLLAILESVAPTEAKFRRASSAPLWFVLLSLMLHTIVFAFTLLAAVIVFLPVHIALSLRGKERTQPAQDIVAVGRS
jgi:hypothetical protein